MKNQIIFLITLLFGLSSCEDFNDKVYINTIVGDYEGFKERTWWDFQSEVWVHDTSDIIVTLSKGESDSVIEINFNTFNIVPPLTFKFQDSLFTCTDYREASLKVINDSLSFFYRAGNAPIWTRCYAKKIK